MDKKYIHVEKQCKTIWKSMCKLSEKMCSILQLNNQTCVELHFPTHLSHLSHQLFPKHLTPINNQSFPLFHTPYNYNYKFFINNNYNRSLYGN